MSIYDLIARGSGVTDVNGAVQQGIKTGTAIKDIQEDNQINEFGKMYQQKSMQEGKPFSEYRNDFIRDVYSVNPQKGLVFEKTLMGDMSNGGMKIIGNTYDEATKTSYGNVLNDRGELVSLKLPGQPTGLANTDRRNSYVLPNAMNKAQLDAALNVYKSSTDRFIEQGGDPNEVPDFYATIGFAPVVDGQQVPNFKGSNSAPTQTGNTTPNNAPHSNQLPTTMSDTDVATDKKIRTEAAEKLTKLQASFGTKAEGVDELIGLIDRYASTEANPNPEGADRLAEATGGYGAIKSWFPSTDERSVAADMQQIYGKSFLASIENMRGFGALSDAEGAKVQAAANTLADMKQGDARYQEALVRYRKQVLLYKTALQKDTEANRKLASTGIQAIDSSNAVQKSAKKSESEFIKGFLEAYPNSSPDAATRAFSRYQAE